MQSRTKRILEATILLAFLMVLGNGWYEHRCNRAFQAQCPEIAQMINQIIQEKTGFKDLPEFGTLFLKDDPGIQAIQTIFINTAPLNESHGFIAVDVAPQWFHENIEKVKDYARRLHQALEDGLVLPVSKENTIYQGGEVIRDSNYNVPSHVIATVLQYLVQWEWLHGEQNLAIDQLADIIRLGQTLRTSPYFTDQIQRMSIVTIALQGFGQFIWTNPGADQDQKILDILQTVNRDTLRFPLYVNSTSPLETLVNWGMNQPSLFIDGVSVGFHLVVKNIQERIKILEKIKKLDKQNRPGPFSLSLYRENSLLSKWTTVPAMKKRMRHQPDSYYDSDPLLPAAAARQIPLLEYTANRANSFSQRYADFNRTNEADALRAVYWARVYHDQHGTWPDQEEFITQNPLEDFVDYLDRDDPNLFKSVFYQLHHINNNLEFANWLYTPPDKVVLYEQSYTLRRYGESEEQSKWIVGMLKAMSPLVKSASALLADSPIIKNEIMKGNIHINSIPDPMAQAQIGMTMDDSRDEINKTGIYIIDRELQKRFSSRQPLYLVELNQPRKTYWLIYNARQTQTVRNDIPLDPNRTYQLIGWDN